MHQLIPTLMTAVMGEDVDVRTHAAGISINFTGQEADIVGKEAIDVLCWMRRQHASIRAMRMCPWKFCRWGGIVSMRAQLTLYSPRARVLELPPKGGQHLLWLLVCVHYESILHLLYLVAPRTNRIHALQVGVSSPPSNTHHDAHAWPSWWVPGSPKISKKNIAPCGGGLVELMSQAPPHAEISPALHTPPCTSKWTQGKHIHKSKCRHLKRVMVR